MLSVEAKELKHQCWQSPWRGIGRDGDGHPLRYLLLTPEEMLVVAQLGVIRIPDSHIPEPVRRQRDRLAALDGLLEDADLARRISLA